MKQVKNYVGIFLHFNIEKLILSEIAIFILCRFIDLKVESLLKQNWPKRQHAIILLDFVLLKLKVIPSLKTFPW